MRSAPTPPPPPPPTRAGGAGRGGARAAARRAAWAPSGTGRGATVAISARAPSPSHCSAMGPPERLSKGLSREGRGKDSEIRVDMFFLGGAGMGHGALLGVADGLGVAPEGAGLVVVLARLPALAAGRQLGVAEGDVDGALIGVDGDE